jgi:hypothetical protein
VGGPPCIEELGRGGPIGAGAGPANEEGEGVSHDASAHSRGRKSTGGRPVAIVWKGAKVALQIRRQLTHFVQQIVPSPKSELVDRVPPELRDFYEGVFRVADEGYERGRVATTSRRRETCWQNWRAFVAPLGVDPYLRRVTFQHAVRSLTGFAGAARIGYFGKGRKVQGGTVSGALSAVAKNIALVQKEDPTKLAGQKSYLPRISQMLDGFKKDDPATVKKMPCTIDLPERMAVWGLAKDATEKEKAVGDLGLIAMYYLLRVGEYTVKKYKNETKQTEQFKLRDVTFFKFDKKNRLKRLSKNAADRLIMTADGFTLKIGN